MSNKKNCAGTYPVRGYKRSDGTEVSAYMRTCGAKHVGDYDGLFKLSVQKDIAKKALINYYIEKYFTPVNEHYRNPKTVANWQGYLELSSKSNSIHDRYYRLALDYENQKYLNNDNIYIKFDDIKDEKLKHYLKYEINDTTVKLQVNSSTDVVIPQYDSDLVQRVLHCDEIKEELKKNLSEIEKGNITNIVINYKDFELRTTIGHGTLYNLRIIDEYICGTHIDYYNFAKKEYSEMYYLLRLINNNAYVQQESGNLRNYLMIFAFRYPIKELYK